MTNAERQRKYKDRLARGVLLTLVEVLPCDIEDWQVKGWLSNTTILKDGEINAVAQDLISGRKKNK